MLCVTTKTRLYCIHAPPVTDEWVMYTTYLARLLDGDLHYCDAPRSPTALSGMDLVLLHESASSPWQRALGQTQADQLAANGPASVLVTRRPLWPVRNILLVLRLEAADQAAADWARRLAQPAGATVTLLPLLPSLPALYLADPCDRPSLRQFLASHTPATAGLRQLLARMEEWHIPVTVSVCPGEPLWQFRQEMARKAYDLLVVGADRPGRFYRLLVGDLAGPMLRYARRPLLIARPSAGEQASAGFSRAGLQLWPVSPQ